MKQCKIAQIHELQISGINKHSLSPRDDMLIILLFAQVAASQKLDTGIQLEIKFTYNLLCSFISRHINTFHIK